VARYWLVRWDLRGQPPYRQKIVPYPNVHLSFVDDDPPWVHGVSTGHVCRELAGRGRVFGVAFRPGCFRPFLRRPVATITGRSVPAADLFGPLPALADGPDDERVAGVEALLRAGRPAPDPVAARAAAIVDLVATDPELTRVEALARRLDTSVRQVQRLFAEYVGVGPKWVIRRYRLHEVTERLANGGVVHWAGLAAELGYADQAHLTRDFTAMFGEPPTAYAARYPAAPVSGG
jgi:AraC-like DNA-binding protein